MGTVLQPLWYVLLLRCSTVKVWAQYLIEQVPLQQRWQEKVEILNTFVSVFIAEAST